MSAHATEGRVDSSLFSKRTELDKLNFSSSIYIFYTVKPTENLT